MHWCLALASTQTLSCKDLILLSLIQREWLHSTAENHRIMELFRLENTSKVIESNYYPSQRLFCSRGVVWLKEEIPWDSTSGRGTMDWVLLFF